MKIFFVINPLAGFGGFQKQVDEVINYLSELDCEVAWAETTKAGEAVDLARQAAGQAFEVVVAVGGDGTINEVCNGLVGTDTALGVLPAGTANVFAAEVGIPIWWPLNPGAVLEAANIILTGSRRRIDLGCLRLPDGRCRYFLMWCGIGLDAAISQAIRPGDTRRLGYGAWIRSGVMVAFEFMGVPATITTDSTMVRKRILVAVVSNGQLYGRIWRMAPEAKMDDGLLDVAIMTGYGWRSTIKHLVGLTFGRHIKDPDFHLYRTTRLSLQAKESLPVHVDAETVGTTPVSIEVAPLALKVIVPADAPSRLFKEPPA